MPNGKRAPRGSNPPPTDACCFATKHSHAWGLVFILIGAYALASEVGWVPDTISFWPIAAITFGLYLLPDHS
ncbi:MAG: DUF5668 domain-containing protein [Candidatus Uhrbacteria bacterium]